MIEIVQINDNPTTTFDEFKNYEERGNVFKKIVEEFASSENIFNKKKETEIT